ncbi:MAG: short-chain dehydrogenase, partial [Acidimicrobiales bacterium]
RWIAPICTWLASSESSMVTGRVFEASGRVLGVANMWHRGPTVEPVDDPNEIGPLVQKLMNEAQPNSDMQGAPVTGPGRPTPY